ncbi:MAG: DUF302 domain-containing protein [Gemmatimonadaceae bacterium]
MHIPNGLKTIASKFTVDETVTRVKDILRAKKVTLFALIDHSGEAAKVGLDMPPTKLLIFGNPIAGTPVMLAAPTAAIDLPLKLLVSEDASGEVWITVNTADYLCTRHDVPESRSAILSAAEAVATAAAG